MAGMNGSNSSNNKSGRQSKKKRNVKKGIIIAVAIIAVVAVSAAAAWNILLHSGKSSLYARGRNISPQIPDELLGGDTSIDVGWEEGLVRYDGSVYRYNEDMLTFLVLGIDKDSEVEETAHGLSGGQADANFLVAINPDDKTIKVICINRDCMTKIDTCDYYGNYDTTTTAQLALAHAYGASNEENAANSVKAVSNLFYGIPIHGYCAINMAAIPELNDAVGTVTLESLETFSVSGYRYYKGSEVNLKGMSAFYYIKYRDTRTFDSNGTRLARQKQYLGAFIAKAKEQLSKNPSLITDLYSLMTPYMTTSVSIDEAAYLGTLALECSFSDDGIVNVKGETVQGEYYEEFYPDDEELFRLIISTFYEEAG